MLLSLLCVVACPGSKPDTDTAGDTGATDSPPPVCEAVAQLDEARAIGTVPSGWEWCHPDGSNDGGAFRRVSAEACDVPFEALAPACEVSGYGNACETDGDCGGGACVESAWGYGLSCECVTPCATDADCGADELCLCAAAWSDGSSTRFVATYPACHPAGCRGAEDCGGADCRAGFALCQYPLGDVACAGEADACTMDADCEERGASWCHVEDGEWTCGEYATCD